MSSVTVFLPCRAGSERVPTKNTRPFAGEPSGLLGIKLRQLLAVEAVDEIVLSTNDEAVLAIGASFASKRLRLERRPEELCTAQTSTDELVAYVPRVCESEHILWTHVTSPLLTAARYQEAISRYFEVQPKHDSLMSVTRLQTFLWNEDGPINYDRALERWPRTQTLRPVYEVNSGIFLNRRASYVADGDRIGQRPFLFELPPLEVIDVDWPEDFELAESVYRARAPA